MKDCKYNISVLYTRTACILASKGHIVRIKWYGSSCCHSNRIVSSDTPAYIPTGYRQHTLLVGNKTLFTPRIYLWLSIFFVAYDDRSLDAFVVLCK
jgi:hypothetical protein